MPSEPQYYQEAGWSGIVSDIAPHALPPGALIDSIDFMYNRPGVAWKRSGWLWATNAFGSGIKGRLVTWVPDFASPKNLMNIASNGHLYDAQGNDIGALTVTPKSWTYRTGGGNNFLIIAGTGAVPRKYNGTTLSALGGSPPSGCQYCTVYRTRLVLGNNSTNPNRSYFSQTPDIEQPWDTTFGYIDSDYPIYGYAPLQNMLLVFTNQQVERLVGSNPPPDTDFDHGVVGPQGCIYPYSIITWQGAAIFANADGVYLTSGTGFRDLTQEGGVKKAWYEMHDAPVSPTQISAGVIRNILILSAIDVNGNFLDCWCCYLPRNTWWRLSHMPFAQMSQAHGIVSSPEDLFAIRSDTNRTAQLSNIFGEASAVGGFLKADDDGTNVLPTLTTRPLNASLSLQHFIDAWINYYLLDAASDNPTLSVQIATGLRGPSFASVAESPFAETTDEIAKRFTIGKQTKALSFKLTQSNPSKETEIYALRGNYNPIAPDRISGQ